MYKVISCAIYLCLNLESSVSSPNNRALFDFSIANMLFTFALRNAPIVLEKNVGMLLGLHVGSIFRPVATLGQAKCCEVHV